MSEWIVDSRDSSRKAGGDSALRVSGRKSRIELTVVSLQESVVVRNEIPVSVERALRSYLAALLRTLHIIWLGVDIPPAEAGIHYAGKE